MALNRFFATSPVNSGGVLPLSASDAHHLRDVLRLTPGEEIVLVHAGVATRVRITRADAGADGIEGEAVEVLRDAALPSVTLVQGLAKGDKMDDVVRQATELGVARIVPFVAERSVVKLDPLKAAARVERWRRVAAEAAKQSQRTDVPEVTQLVPSVALPELLANSAVLVCWEEAAGSPGIGGGLDALGPDAGTDVAVVVGPEGGLTPWEVEAMTAGGAVAVSLGQTVLRTETAGVVAAALALYARGALGGSDV